MLFMLMSPKCRGKLRATDVIHNEIETTSMLLINLVHVCTRLVRYCVMFMLCMLPMLMLFDDVGKFNNEKTWQTKKKQGVSFILILVKDLGFLIYLCMICKTRMEIYVSVSMILNIIIEPLMLRNVSLSFQLKNKMHTEVHTKLLVL